MTVAVDIDYSDVWNNTEGNYNDLTKITVGEDCISSNPSYVNEASGNFRLGTGSPALEALRTAETWDMYIPETVLRLQMPDLTKRKKELQCFTRWFRHN